MYMFVFLAAGALAAGAAPLTGTDGLIENMIAPAQMSEAATKRRAMEGYPARK